MQKTTIYLPDSLKRRLARAAHRRGQSEAALIRAAIERALDEEARPRPTAPLFRSGDPTLAERVDEALSGFGE
jgi:plasmid stability protein